MIEQCDLSERRACRLVGLSRDSYRNPPEADQMTKDLSGKIVEIAHARRRFGYRRIHDMLRSQFPGVNHKRVYRIYCNLQLNKRRKGKKRLPTRCPHLWWYLKQCGRMARSRTGNTFQNLFTHD